MHEALQDAVLDQRDPAGREALGVVLRGTVGKRVDRIVGERERRDGHVLAHPFGEQRSALQHGLTVERAAEDPEER